MARQLCFTREKTNDERELWTIEPHGTNLKRLDNAPEWYKSAKDSPFLTTVDEQVAESGPPSPAPSDEGSPPPSPSPESQQTQHQTGTALDAISSAEDYPPAKIDAPDGSGEIFWRKGKDEKDPLDWVMQRRQTVRTWRDVARTSTRNVIRMDPSAMVGRKSITPAREAQRFAMVCPCTGLEEILLSSRFARVETSDNRSFMFFR